MRSTASGFCQNGSPEGPMSGTPATMRPLARAAGYRRAALMSIEPGLASVETSELLATGASMRMSPLLRSAT